MKTILLEQELSFELDDGVYCACATEFSGGFSSGETVSVVFDGTKYTSTPYNLGGVLAVGNAAVVNLGEDTGEPFLIGIGTIEGVDTLFVYTNLTGETHTVGVTSGVSPNVKLKNYSGREDLYENVEKVWLPGNTTKTTLFPEQNLPFFNLSDEEEGFITELYMCEPVVVSAIFVTGEIVTISIDGTEYVCKSYLLDGIAAVGNASIADMGEDTGEPFLIGAAVDGGEFFMIVYTTLQGDTHTLVVYRGSDVPVPIPYTYGEVLDGVEITPNFTEGNQRISVPDGYLVKEASVLKPDTLTPENIRKDVNVAGITGEYIGNPEEKAVDPDFSVGDISVTPTFGKLLSKVQIKKPETLVPENIAKDVTIAGVTGVHEGGGSGDGSGDGYSIAQIALRNIEGAIEDTNVTSIGRGAFAGTAITEASFPACVNLGEEAFAECKQLSSITLPDVASIGREAFQSTALSGVISFPKCSIIGSRAFEQCSQITEINLPLVSTCDKEGIFAGCTTLEKVVLSTGCSSFGASAFANCYKLKEFGTDNIIAKATTSVCYGCRSLEYVNLSGYMQAVGDDAFNGCENLSRIQLTSDYGIIVGMNSTDNGYAIGRSAFQNCHKLESITLQFNSQHTTFPTRPFTGCSALERVTLKSGTDVVPIPSDFFSYTPIADSSYLGRFGSIYVASSLYTSFRNASGWSNYRARIVSYRT